MRYVVSTDGLAPSERFEFWRDLLAQPTFDTPDMDAVGALPPMQARTHHVDSFGATLHAIASDSLSLVVAEHEPMDVARTRAMIRDCDPEVFYLGVNYRGVQQFVLDRDVVELEPSDMVLLHSSLPLHSRNDPHLRRHQGAALVIDPATVPGGARRLHHLVGRRLSSKDGMVALVAQHLHLLGTGRLHEADEEQLSWLTASLIRLMLARQLEAEPEVPAETPETLFARVRFFIMTRLTDPYLGVDAIASAHHISTRTLHRLFESRGVTVAALIRQLRLERCRAELLNPVFADQPIEVIARRWGFAGASQFSRAYRSRYDESPSAARLHTRQ